MGGAFVLMTKANIGLGVLQIPSVFQSLGMVPGIILLVLMAILIICAYACHTLADRQTQHPLCRRSSSTTLKYTATPISER